MDSFLFLRDFIVCNGIFLSDGNKLRFIMSSENYNYVVYISEYDCIYVYSKYSNFFQKICNGIPGMVLEVDSRKHTYNDYVNYGQLVFSWSKYTHSFLSSEDKKNKSEFDDIVLRMVSSITPETVNMCKFIFKDYDYTITLSLSNTTERLLCLCDNTTKRELFVKLTVVDNVVRCSTDSVFTTPTDIMHHVTKLLDEYTI